MKKGLLALIIIGAIVLIGGCQSCGVYNSLVQLDENVNKEWAGVQSAYQRRADLIPNLVGTVRGAADFERETFVEVAKARAGTLSQEIQVDAANLTPDKLAAIQKASAEAQRSAGMMLNVMVERYPDLKANQNFLGLQDQLEGTENRINTSRNRYNESVQAYNTKIRTFPGNIMASILNFERRTMFEADEGARDAPTVEF